MGEQAEKKTAEQAGKKGAVQAEKKAAEQARKKAAEQAGKKAAEQAGKKAAEQNKKQKEKEKEEAAKKLEEEKTKQNDGGNEGCTKPVVFYSDCEFRNVVSKVMIQDGMTLEKVAGSPRGVFVAEGCRVSLFSKSALTFSSEHPSQALMIEGDGVNRCL